MFLATKDCGGPSRLLYEDNDSMLDTVDMAMRRQIVRYFLKYTYKFSACDFIGQFNRPRDQVRAF